MQPIDYFEVVDKTDWGSGPWDGEPDKRQWQDATTGLPCLIVRGPSGSWCGYVGVPPGHPAHGLHYDGVPAAYAEERRAIYRKNLRAWSEAGRPPLETFQNPIPYLPEPARTPAGERVSELEVHGGLTFADACQPTDREAWESFRLRNPTLRAEAERFPQGDAARCLKQWEYCFDDYDRWVERMQASAICHLAEPGESDHVWWFGFDCAHFGDLMPGINAVLGHGVPSLSSYAGMGRSPETYRDVDYVTRECAQLALQLRGISEEAELDGVVRDPLPDSDGPGRGGVG